MLEDCNFIGRERTSKGTLVYIFKCKEVECSNTIRAQKQHIKIRTGQCRSCSHTTPYQAAYKLMCRRAAKRNLENTLTLEDYREFTNSNCYYCGDKIKWADRGTHSEGISRYCIDRKDNSKGYTKDNTVACCSTCNIAKHKLNESEFIELCRKVVSNWQK